MDTGQKGCGGRVPAAERSKRWPWACVAEHSSVGRASGRTGYAVGDKNKVLAESSPCGKPGCPDGCLAVISSQYLQRPLVAKSTRRGLLTRTRNPCRRFSVKDQIQHRALRVIQSLYINKHTPPSSIYKDRQRSRLKDPSPE